MNLIPHIDIVEPERIQALLRDERNFSWRAVDCETLDTWTPDLGLTSYPRPSILRAGEVARLGRSSTLRHRFWQTVQGQADHKGQRYIGILIYCQAGETCPMELQLASNIIGRVEPKREDNRLHLIVVDQPVEFIGEMEIFRLTAPGAGTYRIESFVLLHERPEADCVTAEIGNASARVIGEADGMVSAHLHFTTSGFAMVDATLADTDGGFKAAEWGETARLHHLVFPGLAADRSFEAKIIANDSAGESAQETLQFSSALTEMPAAGEVVVPLELINLHDADLAGMPMTIGLPLERGAVPRIESCHLASGDEILPAQARAQSHWRDGSVRWAFVNCRTPVELQNPGSVSAKVHINSASVINSWRNDAGADEIENGLRLIVNEDEWQIEQREKGSWREALSSTDLCFESALGNGMALRPSAIYNLHHDARSVEFEIYHEDERGDAHLRSALRLQTFPGQSFLKLHHRLEVISPALAAAMGGDLPAECDERMRAAIVGESGEESTLLKLRSFSLKLPFADARSVSHEGQSREMDGDGWQLRHDHDLAYAINEREHEGRAVGHIRAQSESGSLGVGLRRFWQTYPKALSVDSQGVEIGLFPERAGAEMPGDEHAWHRLYFWLDDDGYLLKAGMALSSEILLDFGDGGSAVFDWLEQGVLARPDTEYLNRTGALNAIGARRDSILPDYEALTDQALRSFHYDREHFRAYGQVNFGDWYGESGWSWGNNEYDPAYCGYSEFLRGGEAGWAAWAAESARHLADVDTINYSNDTSDIGGQSMHMAGHLGGYLPPYFRSKKAGTSSIPSHIWVEGPLLHFLLTGDEAVYQSLMKTKGWLLQKRFFDHYDFTNAREAGWHIIHLSMLALALDDRDCLNAARIIVERVLERQEPEGGWVRNLTDSHCGCGYPRCRGEAGFMVGVLLSGLKRYHHLTGEAAVAEAIIGGARWLIRETFDEACGHFRYTSCPNRSLGGNYQCTQWVLEGLAAAWELSGDREIGRYLKRGLPTIGMFPERVYHLGMGKAMSQQMRYVPTILASLTIRPLEGE